MDKTHQVPGYNIPLDLLESSVPCQRYVSLEPLRVCEAAAEMMSTSDTVIETPTENVRIRSQEKRNRPGRKVSQINVILRQFIRDFIPGNPPPKLENIRYRIMRSLKKVLRRLDSGNPLGCIGLLQFDYCAGHASAAFHRFRDFVQRNISLLRQFSAKTNGPKVDQANLNVTSHVYVTYNNHYIQHVFTKLEIRVAYRLFVALIFADSRPSSLNLRFRVMCCPNPIHTEMCVSKWQDFRRMLDEYLGAKMSEEVRHEALPGLTIGGTLAAESGCRALDSQ